MTRTIKIDLFTDTVCPWCLVGAARLDQAIAALPADVVVDVENHPFYLDPNTPDGRLSTWATCCAEIRPRAARDVGARRRRGEGQRASISTSAKQPRSYPHAQGPHAGAAGTGQGHAARPRQCHRLGLFHGSQADQRRRGAGRYRGAPRLPARRRCRRCATRTRLAITHDSPSRPPSRASRACRSSSSTTSSPSPAASRRRCSRRAFEYALDPALKAAQG
jgi:hypothetical protein